MIKISLSKCYIFIYFRHKMKKKFLLNSLCMFIILLSFHKYCQNYWYSPISSNSPVYCEVIVTKLWFMAWFLVFMTKMSYYQKNRVEPDSRICKNCLELSSKLHPYIHNINKLGNWVNFMGKLYNLFIFTLWLTLNSPKSTVHLFFRKYYEFHMK